MFASLLLLATPGLAAATEADLAWLAGEWCGGGEGERIAGDARAGKARIYRETC